MPGSKVRAFDKNRKFQKMDMFSFNAGLDAVGQHDARIATPDLRFLNFFLL